MTYTQGAALGVVLAIAIDLWLVRSRLVTQKVFWVSYAVIVFFQLIVNGLLTGLEVVRYDPDRILGLRLAYAPVEDILFGFALVLLTLTLWVRLTRGAPRERTDDSVGVGRERAS
ncbi:lycopene cyclase domain-containing protein [Jatrophihabitans fulvus]